jgi:hypothetical protein
MGTNHSNISSTNDISSSSNIENLTNVSKQVKTTETPRMDEKTKKHLMSLRNKEMKHL